MQKTHHSFHFMISCGSKIIVNSQDKGLVGFRTSRRARNEACKAVLPVIKGIYDLNVFPVFSELLPDTHPAMLLMIDSQLLTTTEHINQ